MRHVIEPARWRRKTQDAGFPLEKLLEAKFIFLALPCRGESEPHCAVSDCHCPSPKLHPVPAKNSILIARIEFAHVRL